MEVRSGPCDWFANEVTSTQFRHQYDLLDIFDALGHRP